MKMLKKMISFTLALLMVVSMLPMSVLAEGTEGSTEGDLPKQCESGCTLTSGHDGDCVLPRQCQSGCTLTPGHDGDCVLPRQCQSGCTLTSGHDGDCVLPRQCQSGCTLTSGHDGDCILPHTHTFSAWDWFADAENNGANSTFLRTCECGAEEKSANPAILATLVDPADAEGSRAAVNAAVEAGVLTQTAANTVLATLGTSNQNNDEEVTGTLVPGFFVNNLGRISVNIKTNAKSSLVIELLSGSTVLATSTLKADILPSADDISGNIYITDIGSSWETVWNSERTATVVPDKIVVYGDTVKLGETTISWYDNADAVNAVSWEQIPGVYTSVASVGNVTYKATVGTEDDTTDNIAKAATIGEAKAKAFQAAIDGANGAEIILLDNLAGGNIETDKDFSLNLNDKTYTGTIWVSGTVSIYNGIVVTSEERDGLRTQGADATLTLDDLDVTIPRHTVRSNGGTIIINGGTYRTTGNGTMHAVRVGDGNAVKNTVTINGGKFYGNPNRSDSCAVASNGSNITITITGGEFFGGSGYTIGAWGGILNISGGIFHKSNDEADTLNMGGGDKGTSTTGITGGYFVDKPDTSLLRQDKAAILMPNGDANGNYKNWYRITNAIVKVGSATDGEPYISLKDAFENAKSTDTVTLIAANHSESVTLDTVDTAKTAALDLNGNILDGTVTVKNTNSKLTISGVSASNPLSLTADATTATGYEIIWYKTGTPDNTKVKAAASVSITSEGTYFFQEEPKEYTITYAGLDDELLESLSNPTGYDILDEAITLKNPDADDRTGYTFAGWTGTDLSEAANTVTIAKGSTGDRTYTANWTAIEYDITYNLNGGALETGKTNPGEYTIETRDITLNNPSRTGYTFAGWKLNEETTASTNVTIATGSTGNRTYTATWTATEYTITYELNGGALGTDKTNPGEYTIESNAITLNNPTKTGYTFAGWTGTGLTEAATSVTIDTGSTGNRTYTATWTAIEYDITYDLNGGALGTGKTNPEKYTIASNAITLNNPTKTGYTFAGWKLNEETTASANVTIATGSTGERTYTATWTAIEYTITYTLNGGTVATANPAKYTIETSAITLNNPTRTGYTFAGWTGTGLTQAASSVAIATGSTGNRSYTATWTPVAYTVKFDKTESTATGTIADLAMTYDVAKALTANAFTNGAKKFAGWAISAEAAERGEVALVNGATAKNLAYDETTKTVTLYAVWVGADVEILNPDLSIQKYTYSGKANNFVIDGRFDVEYVAANSSTDNGRINVGIYNVIISAEATETTAAYPATTIVGGLVIEPAKLTATYKSETVKVGQTPAYTVEVTGFVNGETADTYRANGKYIHPTVPTTNTKAGTYKLTPADGSCPNYYFENVQGTLVIEGYEVTKGAEQKVVTGSAATFTINGDADKVVRVWVNNVVVAPGNYTIKSGSTILTFTADYLKNLGLGTHTLTVEYPNGSATTTFTVKAPTPYDPDSEKLSQTGQLNWPMPVMAVLGTATISLGLWFLLKKKENYEG